MHFLLKFAAASALALALPAMAAERVKVGFLTTLSGPGGALGADIRDGFKLAIKHSGGRLGGLPIDLFEADDQQKPEIGKQVVERFLQQNKVDIVTGMVFSNVLLPVVPAILEADVIYLTPNAGPREYAGNKCHPNFFAVSWQSEDVPAAMGRYLTDKGVKNVYLVSANYPGGRESIDGFKRYYKGPVVDEVYTPLGQLDYSAELAALAAKKPDAVFFFLPGGMGINFIKQFVGAGLGKTIALYTPGYSADEDTIKAVGEPMIGMFNSSQWGLDFDNPANRRFVEDFRRDFGRVPTMYASQGYDTGMLLDAAIRDAKGKVEDRTAMRTAIRAANFKSVRGSFRFNNNQYPIQDFYLRVVEKDSGGRIVNRTLGPIFKDYRDPYASQCTMK